MEALVRKMMIILMAVVLLLAAGCGKKADPVPAKTVLESGVVR